MAQLQCFLLVALSTIAITSARVVDSADGLLSAGRKERQQESSTGADRKLLMCVGSGCPPPPPKCFKMLNFTPPTGTVLGLKEWVNARLACKAISPGSDLAYFDSLAQQKTVVSWANTVHSGKPVNEGFFIGLKCTGPNGELVSEGCTWKWAATNQPPAYANWLGNQVPYPYVDKPPQKPLSYYPFCGLVSYKQVMPVRQQVGSPFVSKVWVNGWLSNPCDGPFSLGTVALCRLGNCTP